MKMLRRVVWVVALLGVSVAVMAAASEPAKKQKELTVDGRVTFNTGASSTIGLGARGYGEGDVSEEGLLGLDPLIGEFKVSFVSTDAVDVGASIGQAVWRIEGVGDIWVSRVFEFAADPQFSGAIIGGTGSFASASGEYSATLLGTDPPVIRATFLFDKGIKLAN